MRCFTPTIGFAGSATFRAIGWALMLGAPLATGGCVDTFRGAIVHLNFAGIPSSPAHQHYELFAVVNDGAVSIGRFKVLLSERDCGIPTELQPEVQLVASYDHSFDAEEMCNPDRRIGTVDKLDVLVGGIRIDTAVDLRNATAVFISAETDGDSDPAPTGPVAAGGVVARGIDPYEVELYESDSAYCREHPDDLQLCDPAPSPPKWRRGVILGTLRSDPAGQVHGNIAIVPAEDDTFL